MQIVPFLRWSVGRSVGGGRFCRLCGSLRLSLRSVVLCTACRLSASLRGLWRVLRRSLLRSFRPSCGGSVQLSGTVCGMIGSGFSCRLSARLRSVFRAGGCFPVRRPSVRPAAFGRTLPAVGFLPFRLPGVVLPSAVFAAFPAVLPSCCCHGAVVVSVGSVCLSAVLPWWSWVFPCLRSFLRPAAFLRLSRGRGARPCSAGLPVFNLLLVQMNKLHSDHFSRGALWFFLAFCVLVSRGRSVFVASVFVWTTTFFNCRGAVNSRRACRARGWFSRRGLFRFRSFRDRKADVYIFSDKIVFRLLYGFKNCTITHAVYFP